MELGGVLSFTPKRFTGLQQKRISNLPGTWQRLKASRAPLRQKLAAVPIVFWSAALHGINGSCMGEHHLDKLRSQAMRDLLLPKAGVNGLLRLRLSTTPTADPSWWRLQHSVGAFVRLLRKEPRLLNEWKSFMWNFDGSLFSGPSSPLLMGLGQIGWRVEPTFLIEHDQCHLNLLAMDASLLISVLWDVWLQHVARQVASRKTMRDLPMCVQQVQVGRINTSLTRKPFVLICCHHGRHMLRTGRGRFYFFLTPRDVSCQSQWRGCSMSSQMARPRRRHCPPSLLLGGA